MSSGRHVPSGDTALLRPVGERLAAASALGLIKIDNTSLATVLRETQTLGRSEEANLRVEEESVSRLHCRIHMDSSGVHVEDLGSRNGTFVDGTPVTAGTVPLGGILRAGEALFRLVQLLEDWQTPDARGPLVGGTSLAGVRRQISLVGPTNLPVLIRGETGTGKEVAARLLHDASRQNGPFVAVNCGALPEHLVESELFGHVRGAFTGAQAARKGLFATASGGTLFLDEIGDLPLPAQVKLLRVLEDGLVRPVGSENVVRVNVRVLSATNRELGTDTFRQDLLARLGTVELRMPSLRDRIEDIPVLAAYLLERRGRPPLRIETDALEALVLHDWPLNIREIDNVLQGISLNASGVVTLDHLPPAVRERLLRARGVSQPAPRTPLPPGDDLRSQVEAALTRSRGNVRRACSAVGLSRSHFYRLIVQWGLDLAPFRNGSPPATKSDADSWHEGCS